MLFFTSTIVFFVMHVIPGDPIRAVVGAKAPDWYVEELRYKLGLDKPIHIQYVDYLRNLLRGDLGDSIYSHRPVTYELRYAFPATLELTTAATILSVAVGIPLGVISARNREKPIDFGIRILSLIGFSIPIFWLGLIFQLVFGVYLGILPIEGRYSAILKPTRITGLATLDSILTGNFTALIDSLLHLVLPSVALATFVGTVVSRISRANMIETLNEDYITTARAKGLSESAIIYKHALRNAILPVITVIGMYYALLLGGAVITETIFSFPGMGKLLLDSVLRRDYPMIQGCIIGFALVVLIVTTVIDILYAFLDPRVRF